MGKYAGPDPREMGVADLIVVWGDNECAALATSPNPFNHSLMWGTGVAQTQKDAETKARLSTSFGATVVLSFCSLGTEH